MMCKPELKQNSRLNRLAVSLLAVLWAVTPTWVHALPNSGNIVSGTGDILEGELDMVIQQNTAKIAIDWQSFSIGATESVTFIQPNSSSVALNRVIGTDPSLIFGKITANGQVFLSNPSGVLFGAGSVVDVHGLLATTLNISNTDFEAGNYQFSQGSGSLASVINNGTINAASYVGLTAPAVQNNGDIIVANLGSVALASGTATTLDFNGDGLISFVVTGEVSGDVRDTDNKKLKDRINNSGLIRVNGGQVLLTAKSASSVIGDVINHSGIIEARDAYMANGKITLSSGDNGTVGLSGTLDAPDVFVTADVVAVAASKLLSTNNGDINFVANDLDLKGGLDAGTGDVMYTRADGSNLDLKNGNNPGGGVGSNDIDNITAKNLTLKTDGDISVKGIKEADVDGITDYVNMESGGSITFETVASVFRAVHLVAYNDINVNVDVTTTQGDFTAVADAEAESDGIGDFNVAPGKVITSARDITVTAAYIEHDDVSFNETRYLTLNGPTGTSDPYYSDEIVDEDLPSEEEEEPLTPAEEESIEEGSLATYVTEFLENGTSSGC